MKIFKEKNAVCSICGLTKKGIKTIDFESSPRTSPINKISLCPQCQKQLENILHYTDCVNKESWDSWWNIAKSMTKNQFIKEYIDSPVERIVFEYIYSHGQCQMDSEDFSILAASTETKISIVKKAFFALKKRKLVYDVIDMPGFYGADLKFRKDFENNELL